MLQFFEPLPADEHRDLLVGQAVVFDAFDAAREQILLHAAHDRNQFVDVTGPGDEHA